METKQIQEFYNQNLSTHDTEYEQRRWFATPQLEAGYHNTAAALKRLVWPQLTDELTIMELGPGPGTWTKLLLEQAPNASYDLVDISQEMLGQAQQALGERENVQFIQSDILAFTPKKQYDFFFSSRILEYVPDYQAAVSVIASALRPGGIGYIVTKTPQYARSWRRSGTGTIHNHQIEPIHLVAALAAAGCKVTGRTHVTCVFPGLKSGRLDRWLTGLCRYLPFSFGRVVSESYALTFVKQ